MIDRNDIAKILFTEEAAHFADFTIHKGFHAIVIFPDIAVCSKLPIEHFRHNADAVTPTKHTHKADSLHTGRCGNGGCDIALLVGGLRMADILQKLGPESFRMEVIGAGQCKNMAVAGVTHSLIPLGAVGGQFDIVGPLSPDLIAVKLVYQRILAGEVSCPLHIGVDSISRQQAFLIGYAGKLHISESHIGKPGTVNTTALVIDGFGFSFAKIGGIEAAVGIEDLAVAQL